MPFGEAGTVVTPAPPAPCLIVVALSVTFVTLPWGLYANSSVVPSALMMVVAFPPLILGSTLLETERAFGLPFFDPTRGGDALLWQHLFWIFGHPDVYIIFLPMAGILSTNLIRTIDLADLNPYFHGTITRIGAPCWLASVCP